MLGRHTEATCFADLGIDLSELIANRVRELFCVSSRDGKTKANKKVLNETSLKSICKVGIFKVYKIYFKIKL